MSTRAPGARLPRITILFLLGIPVALAAFAANTVPTDVQQPGTQPGEVNPFVSPDNCQLCHGGTSNPELEPSHGWRGSMMAHSARDPLFWAALAIAEQDFLPNADPALRGGVGDFCLRCHTPNAWLAGRSTPTDGSGLTVADVDGVECEHCHLLVDPDQPTNVVGSVETQTAPFEAFDPVSGERYTGSGQYVLNGNGTRLGPYDDPAAAHSFLPSTFHRQAELCGTCHDVSNPVVGDLAHNNGAQQPLDAEDFSGILGAAVDDRAAFNNGPHRYGIVERTYSEWVASDLDDWRVNDYPSLPPELRQPGGALDVSYHRAFDARGDADYEDGTPRTFTCQTCHMSAGTGVGCRLSGVPTRTDLPRHDLTGGGYWVPSAILHQEDAGTLRFGGGLSQDQRDALAAGQLRAQAMLRSSARLETRVQGGSLDVRVVNLTGHKLISGYPEGRRMWLHVRFVNAGGMTLSESGAYGDLGRTAPDRNGTPQAVHSLLDPDSTRLYEAAPGMDSDWATQLLALGYDASMPLAYDRMTDAVTLTLGQLAADTGAQASTFHFALNNVLTHDSRIPPYGFDRDQAAERNALPVPATQYGDPAPGEAYDHHDETSYLIPNGAVSVEVRLLYQQTSWEYIQFLWLNNDGLNSFLGDEGDHLLDAWLHTGMSEPIELNSRTVRIAGTDFDAPGEASSPLAPADQLRAVWLGGTGRIAVDYTPACDATQHAVYWGDLADVSTHTYSGAVCSVGASGSFEFDPGPGSVFYLVVGHDGAREGSYGRDANEAERPDDAATCGRARDPGGTCDAG